MSAQFHWNLPGLDKPQFTAFVNLLSLRNGGQLDPSSIDEYDELDDLTDDNPRSMTGSIVNGQISFSLDDGLRKRFLDRLGELLSCEKGARHVASAAMKEYEQEDKVEIWVTHNEPLEKGGAEPEAALKTLIMHLEELLSSDPSADAVGYEELEECTWQSMLEYYRPRIRDTYIPNLKRSMKSCRRILMRCIGNLSSPALTQLQDDLKKLYATCFEPQNWQPSMARDDELVQRAFDIRQSVSSHHDMHKLLDNVASADDLWTNICFLGRLRAAFHTFLAMSLQFKGFRDVKIHVVQGFGRKIKPKSGQLSLSSTLELLGLKADQPTIKTYLNKKMSLAKATNEFSKLQAQKSHCHAEVQLILELAKNNVQNPFPYIGCSKRSCWMCYAFIKAYGDFTTRGCHGQLYSRWIVPDHISLPKPMVSRLYATLHHVKSMLKQELMHPASQPKKHLVESTAGRTESMMMVPSEISEPSPNNRLFQGEAAKAGNNQTLLDIIRQPWPNNSGEVDSSSEYYSDPQTSATENENYSTISGRRADNIEPSGGECCVCGEETTYKCSKCHRDWFCTENCEDNSPASHSFRCNLGRPLDSADYLYLACIQDEMPDDPQTLVDFGFNRLYNFMERSALLGLYKGLLLYSDVPAPTLHDWQVNGSLVENITDIYMRIPENCRGHYFPWFCKNKHILDGSKNEDESLQEFVSTFYDEARLHLQVEDRDKDPTALQPEAKRIAFTFFALTLHGTHPSPDQEELYYSFGFCTSIDERNEDALGGLYQALLTGNKFWKEFRASPHADPIYDSLFPITPCTFAEFWQAFESGKLIQLMDERGLREQRQDFTAQGLDTFLSYRPGGACPSVFTLKHFLAQKDTINAPAPVLVDYGFQNCRTHRDNLRLKEVYNRLLNKMGVGPLALHQACISGKLFQFTKSFIPDIEPRFELLMHNLYPLPDLE
ncbi:MAG: hypothetical protein M1834_000969 [Cirrosporium novae-zelandiae]|nr:MAG: hypothetical protein M1834_000969 [Cirrosporium novae-zelandiae]